MSLQRRDADAMSEALALPTLAVEINREHAACEGAFSESLEHARKAGDLLIEAKAQVEHGDWLPWLEANCDFAPRTAQVYMQIARNWAELANTQGLALLGVQRAAAMLGAPRPTDSLPEAPTEGEVIEYCSKLWPQFEPVLRTIGEGQTSVSDDDASLSWFEQQRRHYERMAARMREEEEVHQASLLGLEYFALMIWATIRVKRMYEDSLASGELSQRWAPETEAKLYAWADYNPDWQVIAGLTIPQVKEKVAARASETFIGDFDFELSRIAAEAA